MTPTPFISKFLASETLTKHTTVCFCNQMPTVFLRISQLFNLFDSILRYFFPKKLRSLISSYVFSKSSFLVAVEPKQQQSLTPSCSSSSTHQQHMGSDSVELIRVFQMFDRNGDGRITKRELSESLEKLGISVAEEDLVQMIEKIDVNGDGCVDMAEFGVLYKTIVMGDDADEDDEMREAFNVFDQNGDGFITGEELREVLSSLGLKQGKTEEDCRNMIRMVDVDGDGMVDYKEFKQMMRGTGFAA